ncbi:MULTISPECIES: hypothetical protein [Okeania]|uniref:Uncharacterized protein n=2 Tax=Okeania TaxID=1458928 RepID=A0A3N6MWM5_9CYAN|nr:MULTISPECIES: hypothetical protein [Okeania]NET12454.1 hypothetical protein [Okeania sp. SIO1H6]NES77975.1 hypothetical protein [Okeania sp. SIO1H4]NES91581.1 hypothetical protein [Okeania sp. SIO2B9]NET22517.1 hypothetical protein [Okeania sp. SIO1H5]NET75314.1 hypothetical protein [Okeania sp. SIO1F9]
MVNTVVVAYENYQRQHNTKIAQLTTGALNNSKRRWHEFIVTGFFAKVAINFDLEYKIPLITFRLSSSRDETQPEFFRIFQTKEFQTSYPLENIETIKKNFFLKY